MLSDIKVVDFSKWLPGQYCGMLLGDYGADVIKVESPDGDGTRKFFPAKEPGMSYWHLMLNRGKQTVTADVHTEQGRERLRKLLSDADVFLEGFRPGYLARYGLDYGSVKQLNPRLVYVSITGFGQSSHKPAHDLNVVGLAGLISTDGGQNIAVPDVQMSALTGGTNALAAVCMALLDREKTGEGRYIDVSLYAAALHLQVTGAASLFGCAEQKCRAFSRFTHYYNIYKCKDGRYMTVGTLEPKFWRRFCELAGLQSLAERQFDFAHEQELIGLVAAQMATKTQSEWLDVFKAEEICVTPVRTLREALQDDLTKAQQVYWEAQDGEYGLLHYLRQPFKISDYELTQPQRAGRLGEADEQIFEQEKFM